MPDPTPFDATLPLLEGYTVRRVPGFQARKSYLCPACGSEIGTGVGHVVAWPDELAEQRRPWHLHCWRIAARRGRIP